MALAVAPVPPSGRVSAALSRAQQIAQIEVALRLALSAEDAASLGLSRPTWGEAPRSRSGRGAAQWTAVIHYQVSQVPESVRAGLPLALRLLHPWARKALDLLVIQGFNARVCAVTEGCTAATLRKRRDRALEYLANRLFDERGHPRPVPPPGRRPA